MTSLQNALEAFDNPTQNPDLVRLEGLLSRFNLFEAIGVKRQELRHSDLLACLLDPHQTHGLGTLFLDKMLFTVLSKTVNDALAYSDLEDWDFSQATVQREWNFIDILVLDKNNDFAVIIENKIGTGESSGQLERYYENVRVKYPDYIIVALYLTPEGNAPTSDDYHAVSYSQICQILDEIVAEHRSAVSSDIIMLIEHYTQMLRRHILGDSEVAELCRSIYRKHKPALDTIYEHIDGQEKQIWGHSQWLIQHAEGVYAGVSRKNYMIFGIEEWNKAGLFTTPPHVYFEFQEFAAGLKILLTLSPGDPTYRATVFEMAQRANFPGCQSGLTPDYCRLAVIPILCTADYEKSQEEINAIISEKWAAFLCEDLPQMTQAIREEKWLWETSTSPPSSNLKTQIAQNAQCLIANDERFKLYSSARGWISFSLQEWDKSLKFRQPLTNNAIFPYLACSNERNRLSVGMWIGPGEQADREIVRRKLQQHNVSGVVRSLNKNEWSKISSFDLLTLGDYQKSWEEIELLILDKWTEFVDTELPKMVEAVRDEKWLWELPENAL